VRTASKETRRLHGAGFLLSVRKAARQQLCKAHPIAASAAPAEGMLSGNQTPALGFALRGFRCGIQSPSMDSNVSPPLGAEKEVAAPGWLRLAFANLRHRPWRIFDPLLYPLYRWYEHGLTKQVTDEKVPAHIGLILDGNR